MAKYKVKHKENGMNTTADIDFKGNKVVIFLDDLARRMSLGAFLNDWEVLEPIKEKE